MSVTFEMKGLANFEARLNQVTKSTAVEVRKAINQAASRVEGTAKQAVQKLSSGKVYKRGNKTHIASKPGDAPNTDTGNLVNNIRRSPGISNFGKGYYVLVRAATPYAQRLEYGGGNIKARPFMRPALEKNQAKIQQLLKKAISAGLKK